MPRPTPTKWAILEMTAGTAMETMAKMTKARVTIRRPARWRAPPGERSIIQPITPTAAMRRT